MKKRILIIIILTFITIFTFTQSYATYYDDLTNYKVDPVQYLQLWQENISSSALSTLLHKIGTTNVDDLDEGNLKNLVLYLISSSMYPYFTYQNNRYYVFLYNTNSFMSASEP